MCTMAEKDTAERRVYNLPAELVERLRAFQASQGIATETEAARRLLDSALQMRDTVFSLLAKLDSRFFEEKDLRLLARDVLTAHPLVIRVHFEDDMLTFDMKSDYSGRISAAGKLEYQTPNENNDYWLDYTSYLARQAKPSEKAQKKALNWDSKPAVELDDEIPF